jgi:hypothetical protein
MTMKQQQQPVDPDRLSQRKRSGAASAPKARHTPHEGARRGGPRPDEQEAPDDERRDTDAHPNEPRHFTEPNPTDGPMDSDSDEDARSRRRDIS